MLWLSRIFLVDRRQLLGETCYLALYPENEAASSSETPINFYQIAWCHIPEDKIFHRHFPDTLKAKSR